MSHTLTNRFRAVAAAGFSGALALSALVLASCSAGSAPLAPASAPARVQLTSTLGEVRGERPSADKEPAAKDESSIVAQREETAVQEPAPQELQLADATAAPATVAAKPAAVKPAAAKPDAVSLDAAKREEAEPIVVAALPPSALLAVGAPAFQFSPDDAGKLIGEYFALPRPVVSVPVEVHEKERPWPRSAERLPRDLVPSADFSGPHVIARERKSVVPLRPVVDLAPLGTETETARPARPALPLAPKTLVVGPDLQRLADMPYLGRMDEGATTLQDDPTNGALLQALLAPLGKMRTSGLPFVRPAPLDPFAHGHDFDLKNPPPDADPPARSTAPLPAPVLP
jgi:hypothetical protein